MKGLIIFCFCFLRTVALLAADESCKNIAKGKNIVNLSYNYGTLGFDVSKSVEEISAICTDNVAGCFVSNFGKSSWTIEDKKITAGSYKCVVPVINITYDFSGAQIYTVNEGDACHKRAVLRHELQHFAIWKTSKEWFLKDLKYSLQNTALENAVHCPRAGRCRTNAEAVLEKVKLQVEQRWNKIERQNQLLLDQVDHSAKEQVNYPVCAPYSLKVDLF